MNPNKQYTLRTDEPDYAALGMPEPAEVQSEVGRRVGMTVPEGFFAEMQRRVEAEIDRTEHIARLRRLRRWSVAASVALIVGLFTLALGRWDTEHPVAAEPAVATAALLPSADVEAAEGETDDDMLLARLSDYDIYEAFFADLE